MSTPLDIQHHITLLLALLVMVRPQSTVFTGEGFSKKIGFLFIASELGHAEIFKNITSKYISRVLNSYFSETTSLAF